MPIIIRSLIQLAKNWRAILSLAGLVVATGFSSKLFVKELGESASKFWWIAGLACLVLLGREYIRGYFKLKREELRILEKK